jgi:hypothetical protein
MGQLSYQAIAFLALGDRLAGVKNVNDLDKKNYHFSLVKR